MLQSKGIETAFTLYLESLKAMNHSYFQWTHWQVEDLYMPLREVETAWIRSRRGGKSRDLTILAVFFALCGFDLIWLAAKSDQLKQAKKYLMMNPYVAKVKVYSFITLNGKESEMGMITKARVASKGVDILIYDEGAKIDINLLEYEYYQYSRAMIAQSTTRFHRILHASTPSLASVIEEVYRDLLEINPDLISIHPYTDCNWIDESFVEEEERKNGKWYVDQEYRCLFVPHGGQLLSNISIVRDMPEFPNYDKQWGLDLNVTLTLSGIYVQGNDCYVTDEKELDWFNDIERQEITSLLDSVSIEMESEGFNYYQAREWAREYSNLIYVEWSKENKGRRLVEARKFDHIYIDPKRTPKTYGDLSSAISHPTENIWLKDTRHPSHWTDSFMHAVGAKKINVFDVIAPITPKANLPSWRRQKSAR